MQSNKWDPAQYEKFEKERDLPFFDLLDLIRPHKEMSIVDLGCGTGRLTKILHDTLKAKKTLGVDNSSTMLEKSNAIKQTNLEFQHIDIEQFVSKEKFDLIFSNLDNLGMSSPFFLPFKRLLLWAEK